MPQALNPAASISEPENGFQILADVLPQIVWTIDGEGRVDYLNRYWADYTGTPCVPMMVADMLRQFMHPEDGPRTLHLFETARRDRVPFACEHRIRSHGGDYRWFLVKGEPVFDSGGQGAVRWVGTALDIHDRKLAEDALRESEKRQRFLLALGDSLRALKSSDDIEAEAGRLLGTHLSVDRAGYGEIVDQGQSVLVRRDWSDGALPSLAGEARILDAFGPALIEILRSGQTLVVEDSLTDPRAGARFAQTWDSIGTRALIVVPLVRSGDLQALLYLHSRVPRAWQGAEAKLAEEVANRTWEAISRARAEDALRQSERRLRLVQQAARIGSFEFDRVFNTALVSPEYLQLYGLSPEQGNNFGYGEWLACVHPEDKDAIEAQTAAAVADPACSHLAYEFRTIRPDTGEVRWISARTELFRDEAGRFIRSLGAQWDITAQREASERMAVMVAELQHRTRNLLSVVRSLASQTARESGALPQFLELFSDRLAALSRVQGLLSRKESEPITIGALVHTELDAMGATPGEERIVAEGPEVMLRPTLVQTLALAIHELATNARKYGALSTPEGRLTVSWSLKEDAAEGRQLKLQWVETGFPASSSASRAASGGFGRTLIERALPYSMGAETRYELTEASLFCSIDLALDRA